MEKFTLEEKMLLCVGDGMWHTNSINGKLPRLHLSDGPHGLRKQEDGQTNNDSILATCFPTASALACSFDEALVAEVAASIAKEAFNEDVSVLLGPGINMKRSPTCGRNFEYYSEDPFLAGKLGSSYVKAVQQLGVATCLKHFAANSQETKRMSANSIVDDKALHSIYLKAFEMVIKEAKPASIMASYNRINNYYATENSYLLTDILKNKWGYEGTVISDWGACINVTKAIQAGMSLEMPSLSKAHIKQLQKDYKEGFISEDEINKASSEVFKLIQTYAIINRTRKEKYDISNNHEIAIKASEESAVLLKNESILPLKTKKITIIGGLAESIRYQGGGSSHINTNKVKDGIKAFEDEGYEVSYAKGYEVENDLVNEMLVDEALLVAKDADVILFYGGLTDISEGEGYDRKSFDIPLNQVNLLNKLYELNSNIIFISFGGSPYNMEPLNQCKAILSMYLSGEGVSEAIVHLVSGTVNPSGKLAETIPYKLEDVPSISTFATRSNDVMYKESIFIGYRYYDTFDVPVRYCFGYGLSYSRFEYSNLKIQKIAHNQFEVSFDITNTSELFGKEIAQIYVKANRNDYLHPNRELKGFKKVSLNPHECKNVSILLDEESFKEYDIDKCWIVLEDDITIEVSSSLNTPQLSDIIHIEGTKQIENESLLYSVYFDKNRKLKDISDEEFKQIYRHDIIRFDETLPGHFTMANSLNECKKYSFKAKLLLKLAMMVTYHQFKGKRKDDPEVMMMIETVKDGTMDCVCTQGGIPYRIGESIILSCNKKRMKAFIKLIRG